ncbi:MAG: hypothetical protein ACJ790_12835 [Myxococcaceae bacterium]
MLNRSDRPAMFPMRTLLLMVLALVAFGRLWCVTHQASSAANGGAAVPAVPAVPSVDVQLVATDGGTR